MLTPVFRRLKSRNWKSPYRIAFAAASSKTQHMVSFHVQGQPLGFDTKYLALVDRNMQVRFSLKVVWES